ncbi:uncharacterized protein BKCO1_400073 [Diplodia corticola]|uniref:SET domain-containing protein n=1 Tax=Diplodia corticola TaxID=236234 RepID=A0A1J9RAW4_9PEZI|nr:uncharacterized protein BKCO1_400073 [Diplodia corticola]OJD38742.1 hypothetical protein BKCO1_400073 [Diplodia corticola]
MSSTDPLPTPFSSQWRAGHWQASNYANLMRDQRLARLNDILDKAHDHHMAEKTNNRPVLDSLRTTMNAPPYVSAAWVGEQLAAASLPKKKNKKKGKKGKKNKKKGGVGLEAEMEKTEYSNSRFMKYMKLLVSSQKALPPLSPSETNFLREGVIGDTARAITGLAHSNEYPISHRIGDAVPVALVNIPQGSTIYQEQPWITLRLPLDPSVIIGKYCALSAEDQALFDSLGHNVSADFIERQLPTLKDTHPVALNTNSKEHAIIATWLTHQDPGLHICSIPTTSRRDSRSIYPHLLQHVRTSCSPNCHLIRDDRYNGLVLRSARAIPRGEPITYCPIPDYMLFTHDARAVKLHETRGLPSCKCDLCCPLIAPPPLASGSTTTTTPSKTKDKNNKGKATTPTPSTAVRDSSSSSSATTTTVNPDAIPLMRRIAIETRRQQTAHAWSAWRALRDPFWSSSPSSPSSSPTASPLPPPTHNQHPSPPSPQTIESLALRLDNLLSDNDAAATATAADNNESPSSSSFPTVSPLQAWLRSDASHALQDAGDWRGAAAWARRELEADAVLLGVGHEGCRATRMRVVRVVEEGEVVGRVKGGVLARGRERERERERVGERGEEGGDVVVARGLRDVLEEEGEEGREDEGEVVRGLRGILREMGFGEDDGEEMEASTGIGKEEERDRGERVEEE